MRALANRLEDHTDETGRLTLTPAEVSILLTQIRTGADYVDALRAELKAHEALLSDINETMKGRTR
jgi:hypothetical protein